MKVNKLVRALNCMRKNPQILNGKISDCRFSFIIYRQSPVKITRLKNIIVVTFTFLLKVPHFMEATYNGFMYINLNYIITKLKFIIWESHQNTGVA